jgi:glycosyltransferase involved in cell wall biosynthesis
MPTRLFLNAMNVHRGGGKSLLWSIIKALPGSESTVLILDSRMTLPKGMPKNIQLKIVPPSILQRARAERWLVQNVQAQDVVLCFGNLPPLFKLRGRTVVFVQNRYLTDDVQLRGFSLRVRLQFAIERLWLYKRMENINEFIVQTPTMKRLLEMRTGGTVPIRVLPFIAESGGCPRKMPQSAVPEKNDYDFVYVASGEPHKNHRRLLEAWRLLAETGRFPSLCLTLDRIRFATLCLEIEALCQRHGLNVSNTGELSHTDVLALYKKTGAFIYPSTLESFGLPLIEARQAGLPIVAAELDYVRDVVDPEESFDPSSAYSIARAVKRFMGETEDKLEILDAVSFLNTLAVGKQGN